MMILNVKLSTFLFLAFLSFTCNSLSIFEKCYKPFPKFSDPSQFDGKAITENINKFYVNFDERYKELETFIKNNISQSDDVTVKFFLYTPQNKDEPDHLHRDSLNKSHFNDKLPIKVLVHGLQPLKNFSDTPYASLKHALLLRREFNVIIMNYEKVARMPYTEALKYSFLVAKNAADNLQFLLKTFKLTSQRLHLIGFGFGGQLVGNIGHHIPGLARITALDPASAIFDRFPEKYRISPDDANFVDIIHTSTKKFPRGLGLASPAGHQDFYPNGGKKQPGCKHNITAEMAGSRDAADFKNAICDQSRSIELFIESVCDRLCSFRGNRCDSYKDYLKWHCLFLNSATATMGLNARMNDKVPKRSKFYLDTKAKYPYCKYF